MFIDDPTWLKFVDTGSVSDTILQLIAFQISIGEILSVREQAIRLEYSDDIENHLYTLRKVH